MRKLYIALLLALAIFKGETAIAQFNPLTSQYYTNGFLANPALAGVEQGVNLNLAYRKQWANIPGSPEIQNFTGVYGAKNEKVGLGLNVNFDKAGLQKLSTVSGTYAYHLPLSGNGDKLHFGLSLGFTNQRLSSNDIVGNNNDPSAADYNQRKTIINGDFGVAYTANRLKIEAAVPNLKQLFKKDELAFANLNTFYSAVSYVIAVGQQMNKIEVEPKLVYRGISKLANIWDLGTQVSFANQQVMLMGMYHSTKSASFGVGTNIKKKYQINASYTTQTGALKTYTDGSFEINLGLKL